MNNHSSDGLCHVPITIEENQLNEGAWLILKAIRPHWEKNQLNFKLFTDGITNKLVGCFNEAYPDDVVLVRVYGQKTDLLIDRKAETRNIKLLHRMGYAPRLYATFRNGLAYEFAPGRVLDVSTVRDPAIYPLVARMMALIHRVDGSDGQTPQPILWDKTQRFLNLMPDHLPDPAQNARLTKLIPDRPALEREFNLLRTTLEDTDNPIVFCHNDLLLGNVIYNSTAGTVTFIDYEYAGYNYQAFDIGNHFAEFPGVTDVDYNLYPDASFQRKWLEVYLETYLDRCPSKKEIETLLIQVNKFSLASHFFWGIWSLIQAEHSLIDFDFLGYAVLRLNEYFVKREKFLYLMDPSHLL